MSRCRRTLSQSSRGDGCGFDHPIVEFIGVFPFEPEGVLHPFGCIGTNVSGPHPWSIFGIINLVAPLSVLVVTLCQNILEDFFGACQCIRAASPAPPAGLRV
jgi:hypothetical protein